MYTIYSLFLKRLKEISMDLSTPNQVSVHNCINGNLAALPYKTPRNQAMECSLNS